jgi:hypothetical protein
MLMRVRGPERHKLRRIATIMDNMVDWERVQNKADVVTALFQGELEPVSPDSMLYYELC